MLRLSPGFSGGKSRRALIFVVFILSLVFLPALAQEGSKKWSVEIGSDVQSSPAIGDEGIIYFGADDENLWAVEPDGDVKWTFPAGEDIRQPPVIGEDGTIYVGTHDGRVFAVNVDGTQKWEFDPGLGGQVYCEMALAENGTLYVSIAGGGSPMIFALNPDGSQYWSYTPAGGVRGIVIGPGGIVVLSESNGRVTVLDSQGVQQWSRDDTGPLLHPAIFTDDETMIVTGRDEILAYSLDGTLLWEVETEDTGDSSSTAVNGDLYVPLAITAGQGGIVCRDPADGSEKWRYEVPGRVQTTPLVGADGVIYFGSDDDKLYAINPPLNGASPQGAGATLRWSFETENDIRSSAAIGENGTIYFGSLDNQFYAVNSSSAGLAGSSSPMKQVDVRHTGRFGSDVTRRRFFAAQVYWLSEESHAIVAVKHIGGSIGLPTGTTAEFRIDVLNRDGSVHFSIEDSVEPGEIKRIVLKAPDGEIYAGAAILDAPIKDGTFLAPFLTWKLDVSAQFEPLDIGASFQDPTQAARVHFAPAEASQARGLGIAVLNIGENTIPCTLQFFNEDGTPQVDLQLELVPRGSEVRFFNEDLPDPFVGSATLSCQDPVVAFIVIQDFSNGAFPSDFITVKGPN